MTARPRRPLLGFSTAVVAGVVVLCFVGAPILAALLGHGPDTLLPAASPNNHPVGPLSWVNGSSDGTRHGANTLLLLGADGTLGRDLFLRLLAGGRVSLEIAGLASVFSVVLGTMLGCLAGLREGLVDDVLTFVADFGTSFPFILAALAVWLSGLNEVLYTTFGVFPAGVIPLATAIAAFTWFGVFRGIRAHVRSLRTREFVAAAEMVGCSNRRIVWSHLGPHLVGPLSVYAAATAARAMIAEVALAFLGVRVPLPGASWGGMVSDRMMSLYGGYDLGWRTFVPIIAIAITSGGLFFMAERIRKAAAPGSIQGRRRVQRLRRRRGSARPAGGTGPGMTAETS